MKIADSYHARVALQIAIARIQVTAEELKKAELTDQQRFEIVWSLAFRYLQDLEEYRLPD